ncbi:flagellar basal body rod protein FlgB [Hydrogenovibrio halophilus]|uniref:flagellar basal body rod protein FlgB n=1 Tax=Hydrogenovibrio halophilus TaxID=373391 RepID=UPI000381778E|nr:flagellar basal body rod protein FlgB [Hydrogenovibrio halophilus]
MDSIFGVHEEALNVRTARQKLLANNLANQDTPNFKARDIDWRAQMKQASDELSMKPSGKPDMQRTHSGHITGFAEMTTDSFVKYRQPTQPALDGNTVEAHIEKAQFMENSMQYQASLEFINSKIKGIKGALSSQ